MLNVHEPKKTDLDLRAEATLDGAIRVTAPHVAGSPVTSVFLTGATGFVGAYLVDALVQRGVREVHCLTRAASDADARERILANLRKYDLATPRVATAVAGVSGDLSAPRFGLSESRFHELGERLDAVVHGGAWVHLEHPYEVLRPTNVWGTREALRLAVTGRTKRFCHISGMSVFLHAEQMVENAPPPYVPFRRGGYFDSKWVAERLVWEAFERGLPGIVFRLGWMSGDAARGLIAEADAMTIFIRACVRLGAAPKLPIGHLQCTPVDLAARIIGHGTLDGSLPFRGCNLWSTHSLAENELWSRFGTEGNPIEIVAAEEWLERVRKRFPMILPAASAVLGRWSYPTREDAIAQELTRRVGEVPSNDALLSVYVPAWLRKRTQETSRA